MARTPQVKNPITFYNLAFPDIHWLLFAHLLNLKVFENSKNVNSDQSTLTLKDINCIGISKSSKAVSNDLEYIRDYHQFDFLLSCR